MSAAVKIKPVKRIAPPQLVVARVTDLKEPAAWQRHLIQPSQRTGALHDASADAGNRGPDKNLHNNPQPLRSPETLRSRRPSPLKCKPSLEVPGVDEPSAPRH